MQSRNLPTPEDVAAAKRKRTILIVVVSVVLVILLAIALVPLALSGLFSNGVKTEGIDESRLKAAETGVDGEWSVTKRPGANSTSAGFTFSEVLPGQRKVTSASTEGVTGNVTIEAGTLTAGEITVDLSNLTSDSDVRDANVRRKLLHTDTYPEATFRVTEPADVSQLPEDGSVGTVELTGEMTIHGETNPVTHAFTAARSGSSLYVAGDVPINRLDYGVESPEFVAATINEEGEVNVRLHLTKD